MGAADMYHKESLYLHRITLVIRIFYDLYSVTYKGYKKDLCSEVIKSKKLIFFTQVRFPVRNKSGSALKF